jgi:hypothetical protein
VVREMSIHRITLIPTLADVLLGISMLSSEFSSTPPSMSATVRSLLVF